jgi:transcriptional regulator with XRE-family HTH domain
VYRWEHELCLPRNSVLKKMATFYGVSYDWLVTGDEKENAKIGNGSDSEKNIEQKILKMMGKLSENGKYNVIGYIERIIMEEENGENGENN